MQTETVKPTSLVETLARQSWLDRVADPLQEYVGRLLKGDGQVKRRLKDFLHGTGFGHPLHPAITDAPVGAWTAAVALDAAEALTGRDLGTCSSAAIGLGLLSGLGAAVTGAADWSETYGEERRIGVAHALGNATALVLFGLSLAQRLRGRRFEGRVLSSMGYTVAVASAYVGGDLVFRQGTGVNRTAWFEAPKKFTAVMAEADLPEGEPRSVRAGRAQVVLVRQNGHIHALCETCAHAGGPLGKGKLEDGLITCPWHGSQYRVSDGEVVHGPSAYSQPCLEVRISEGQIEVRRGAGN